MDVFELATLNASRDMSVYLSDSESESMSLSASSELIA